MLRLIDGEANFVFWDGVIKKGVKIRVVRDWGNGKNRERKI